MIKNDKNPLVSIIVPIYNTKSYLVKCLKSLCGQTYSNMEIICIDDGSTDGSAAILDAFALKDKRIRAIHKSNGGESSARNVGLKLVRGQYVGFMDCDDWIEPEMYEKLVDVVLEKGVDVVASSWYKETEAVCVKIENQFTVPEKPFNRSRLLQYIYHRDQYRGFAYMWNKLYRRELFYDEKGELILFDEDLALGGDVLYLARLALNAKSACYIDEAFYHYYQRSDSGFHTHDLQRRKDWIEAYRRVILWMQEYDVEDSVLIWVKRFAAYVSSKVAEMALEQKNKAILLECQQVMRSYYAEYVSTNREYTERIEQFNRIMNSEIVTQARGIKRTESTDEICSLGNRKTGENTF